MRRTDAEQVIIGLMKPIYGFTLKRCRNIQDAEDLTQEICLKAFRALMVRDDIADPEKFIWTMAHNALSNYYRGKQSAGMGIDMDKAVNLLSSDEDVSEQIIQDETKSRLYHAIAYLSKLQRKIVIAYYYENKKQQEIAKELDIPLGTVKWHLFEAKRDLKKGMDTMRNISELKFNPIRFSIMGLNGSVGTMGGTSNFFRSILSQNIAYAVYRQPKTINQIADYLGVSPVYIESEAEFLEEYGFLIKNEDKYLANLLIDEPSQDIARLQEEMYTKAANLFANELYDALINSNMLKSEGLVCHQPDNFILWALIPYIAAHSGENLREATISFDEVATIRPDGAKNIAYASITSPNAPKPKYYDSMLKWCGPCWNGNEAFVLWLVDSEWSEKRVDDHYQNAARRDLSLLKRYLNDEPLSKDEYVYLIERGYIKSLGESNGKFESALQIVWIKDNDTRQKLIAIGNRIKEKYHEEFNRLKEPFVQAVLDDTPQHLRKMRAFGLQYIFFSDGWFLLYCMKELVNSGKLQLPTEDQKKSLTTLIVPM